MVSLKTHWSTCRSGNSLAALSGYTVWRSRGAKRSHKPIIKTLHGTRHARANDTQDETTG